MRRAHKDAFQEAHGIALTYLPFVVHAVVRALREFPRVNSSLIDENIVEKQDIHVGVAVETEKGLVVPVVRHADRLSLAGTAMAMDDLSTRARSRKLSATNSEGGPLPSPIRDVRAISMASPSSTNRRSGSCAWAKL